MYASYLYLRCQTSIDTFDNSEIFNSENNVCGKL